MHQVQPPQPRQDAKQLGGLANLLAQGARPDPGGLDVRCPPTLHHRERHAEGDLERELEADALGRGRQRPDEVKPPLRERRGLLTGQEPGRIFSGEEEMSGRSFRVSRCLVQQSQFRGHDRTVVVVKRKQGPRHRCGH